MVYRITPGSAGSAALALLCGLAFAGIAALAQAQELTGNYAVIGGKAVPAPHSIDVLVVEEFLNFSCPHCYDFRAVSKPVFTKYGKRMKLVRVPILFRGQSDPALRLFYIAQAHGMEAQIDDALFEARFVYNQDNFDPQIVGYLARTNNLQAAYEKEASAGWVTRRIADGHALADSSGVEATPTLVLQGAIRLVPETSMADFVRNFDKVAAQLLK
jgi:thiol:disulfide interchange protein DsbA